MCQVPSSLVESGGGDRAKNSPRIFQDFTATSHFANQLLLLYSPFKPSNSAPIVSSAGSPIIDSSHQHLFLFHSRLVAPQLPPIRFHSSRVEHDFYVGLVPTNLVVWSLLLLHSTEQPVVRRAAMLTIDSTAAPTV